jgi:zinc D-Ala-D-Ala carboxypeptidase
MATSTHFKDAELRCPHCGVNNVKLELLSTLEQLRAILDRPIILTSAYRCPVHELTVSGKSGGAHVDGDAADIFCVSDRDRFNLIRTILELGVCRLGIGPNFIHADISDTLPQAVTWTYYPA